MLIDRDNFIISKQNDYFKMAVYSTVGGRDDQQDSAGYEMNDNSGIFVVCDGMGGHQGGKKSSSIAVNSIIDNYDASRPDSDVNEMLLNGINEADERVSTLKNEFGDLLRGGTTAAVAVIRRRNLYWISAGDSRIYIYRKGEFVQITTDHIYEVALRENKEAGLITQDFYDAEIARGEVLISFVGVGGLPLIDKSINPVTLQKDDLVLIMSDGLYKNVPDKYIKRCVENFKNPIDSLHALENRVRKMTEEDKSVRDNMTVMIIRMN